MTDLRTRIAAAIYKDNDFGWSKYMCEEAADAVIAELGLTEERDRPYSTVHNWRGDWRHRYVTEWVPANE